MTTLCFIDTETTGLDPERHEVWEVAIILRHFLNSDDLASSGLGTTPALQETTYVWQLPVDLARADTIALNIGHFHERRSPFYTDGTVSTEWQLVRPMTPSEPAKLYLSEWVHEFARLTWGAHMIGCVPSFDTDRFLERLLRAHGACPGWHYQPIDVETLAVGSILGTLSMMTGEESVRAAIEHVGDEAGAAIREHSMKSPADHPARFATSRRFFLERAGLPWDSERLSSWFGIDPERYERHSALGDARWARDLWDAIWEGATQ